MSGSQWTYPPHQTHAPVRYRIGLYSTSQSRKSPARLHHNREERRVWAPRLGKSHSYNCFIAQGLQSLRIAGILHTITGCSYRRNRRGETGQMARKRASEPGNTAGAAYSARFWLWRALLVAGWSLLILYIVAGAFTLGRAIANGASPSSDLFFDALALDIPSRQSLAFVITAGIVALALLVASVTAALVDGRKPALPEAKVPKPAGAESKKFTSRVFISHSHADNPFGLALYKKLKSALGGAPDVVWYDKSGSPENAFVSGLPPGVNWWEEIQRQLSEREICIVILSPKAMASKWVLREVNIAVEGNKALVLVLHQVCEVPNEVRYLRLIEHVSFLAGRKRRTAFAELLAVIKLGKSRLRNPDPAARALRPEGVLYVPNLVGRDTEVAEVEQLLRPSATSVICVQGMPGVGKSAFAAWITKRAPNDSQAFPGGAAWIPCDDLKSDDPLQEVYARLANFLARDDIAGEPDPAARQRKLVEVLRNRPRTLLTFDNIGPGFPVEALIEHLAIQHFTALLLMTTETLEMNPDHLVHLAPLEPTDGVQLFVETRARKGYKAPDVVNETPHVVTLVNQLGCLPLAIYLTAGYCATHKLLADRMVRIVNDEHLDATAFADPKIGLAACFERSLHALPVHCQLLFAGLCLFKGASLPQSAGRRLSVALRKAQPDPPDIEDTHEQASGLASAASLMLHTIGKTVAGDGAITALVNAALVDAVEGGERLRIHPLLREYALALFQNLDVSIQNILGFAMADYWATFAEQHATEFGDLDLAAESDGIAQAIQWAQEHGDENIIARIRSAQAKAGARRTRRFLNVFSWAERAGATTGSFIENLLMIQTLQAGAADILAESRQESAIGQETASALTQNRPGPIIHQYLATRDTDRQNYAYLEVTYAWMLDHVAANSSSRFSLEDQADTYFNRANNQFKWAQTEADEGNTAEALAHASQARIYAVTALGLGYEDALSLINEIAATIARISVQVADMLTNARQRAVNHSNQ